MFAVVICIGFTCNIPVSTVMLSLLFDGVVDVGAMVVVRIDVVSSVEVVASMEDPELVPSTVDSGLVEVSSSVVSSVAKCVVVSAAECVDPVSVL